MSIPETPIPKEEYERSGDQTCVTETLIEKYHTAEGVKRFRRWSIQSTLALVMLNDRSESAYFPADYERWIELGLP